MNTGVAPLILDSGTRWRRVSFTLHLPYSQRTLVHRYWVGPRDDLRVVEKERDLVPDGNKTPDRPACTLVNIATSLFWFACTVSTANNADK